MKSLRFLLFPFALVYLVVTRIRNLSYDKGWTPASQFPIRTIGVGNLSVGGTGKTPMVELLIELLGEQYQIGLLSRGYGRQSKGFLLANDQSTALDIGDEPLQIKQKFPDISVAVDGNRCRGIGELLKLTKPPQLVVLDDVFQHRSISTDVSILLTTYSKPYFNDFILPVGNLRESKSGARRADMIVVTKCPADLSQPAKDEYIARINPMTHQSVWFSSIDYSEIVYSSSHFCSIQEFLKQPFTLVTGIANSAPLVEYLEKLGAKFKHLSYSDHHHFSEKEIERFGGLGKILTTEKDFVRLQSLANLDDCYYIPIKTKLIDSKDFKSSLEQLLKQKVS